MGLRGSGRQGMLFPPLPRKQRITSDKPTSASKPMACAIHMGDSPGLRRPSAVPGQSKHGADKDSRSQSTILASALISGICAIHTGSSLFSAERAE
jgi:hypothetical protein